MSVIYPCTRIPHARMLPAMPPCAICPAEHRSSREGAYCLVTPRTIDWLLLPNGDPQRSYAALCDDCAIECSPVSRAERRPAAPPIEPGAQGRLF